MSIWWANCVSYVCLVVVGQRFDDSVLASDETVSAVRFDLPIDFLKRVAVPYVILLMDTSAAQLMQDSI